jgi:hypothetical protein
MKNGYIDKSSWYGLLGVRGKIIDVNDEFAVWEVKNTNVAIFNNISDIDKLDKHLPFNTYYLNDEKVDLLKDRFNLKKTKAVSASINIEGLSTNSFVGRRLRNLRLSINKGRGYNLEIRDELKSSKDMKEMISRWSVLSGEKYFQDRSGKNVFYYDNGFHGGCINLFLYDKDKLVSFGTLSMPEEGHSSYINGKALCMDYPGISEYTDVLLYEKAKDYGVKSVNLGAAEKGLHFYKMKFPGAYEELYYHAKVFKR